MKLAYGGKAKGKCPSAAERPNYSYLPNRSGGAASASLLPPEHCELREHDISHAGLNVPVSPACPGSPRTSWPTFESFDFGPRFYFLFL